MSNSTPIPTPNPQKLLDFFFQYVASLYLDWYTFDQLFGENKDVDRLNRRTGSVFGRIQSNLLDSILLDIAKLFDNAKVSGKVTASLKRAIEELQLAPGDPNLLKLNADVEALKTLGKPIVTHRHRRIAHNDRAIAVGDDVLPGVTRKLMREVVEGIGVVVSQISIIHTGTGFHFAIVALDTGVPSLFKVLEAGNQVLDDRRRRRHQVLDDLSKGIVPEGFDLQKDFVEDPN